MRLTRMFASWCVALALLIAGTAAGHAQSVDCVNPGDLQTAVSALSANQTLTVTGTCTGTGTVFIGKSGVTLVAGTSGAIVDQQIIVTAANVTLSGLTIDGASLTGTPDGVIVVPYESVILSNCTIEHWSNGVRADGTASISGGIIKNNTSSGVYVVTGGEADIGEVFTFASGTSLPVEITANPVGVTVDGRGAALLNAPDIHANTSGGVSVSRGGGADIVSGTIANNGGDGIDITDGAVSFNTDQFGTASPTAITANSGDGIYIISGLLDLDQANIQSNVGGGANGTAGYGIEAQDGANVKIGGGMIESNSGGGISASNDSYVRVDGTTLSGNAGGPAVMAEASTVHASSTSVSVSATLGHPAIFAYHSAVQLKSVTVTGPGNANTLAALGGSTMLLYQTSITASDSHDATVLVSDGSTVDSVGGNIIHNAAAADPVMAVSNASTFHEVGGPLTAYFTPSADSIIGTGSVQVQSNMELGTGGSASSSWTGAITVSQNSSFRMDGGMTITGTMTLGQSSNGFFNKALGGTNSVTGVVCAGTNTSHVGGPAAVSPPVTIVTTGSGCYAF